MQRQVNCALYLSAFGCLLTFVKVTENLETSVTDYYHYLVWTLCSRQTASSY